VDATTIQTVTGDVAIGALRTSAAINNGAGTNTLRIGSGGFLTHNLGAVVIHSVRLDFTGVEGIISNVSNQVVTFSGLLTAPDGITKFGANSVVFSNASNNVSGGITIAEANLRPGVTNGLGTNGVVNILAAGTLDLNGFSQSIRGLIGTGVVNNNTGSSQTLTLNTVNASDEFEFSGTIRNAAQPVALAKTGPGTQILSGSLNYTGATTISGGVLQVDGVSTAVSAYTVNSGGTLAGGGIITGALTANSGGIVAPGADGPGSLRVGALTLSAGAIFDVELNGTAAGTGYDQLDATGAVSLNGSVLDLSLGYIPTPGDKFFILNNDQIDLINGTFAGLSHGSTFSLTSSVDSQEYLFEISYNGEFYGGSTTNGNDVAIIAVVPEPGTAMCLLTGLGLLAASRRRRTV
jgi:autotransporter-associated beta strand protein